MDEAWYGLCDTCHAGLLADIAWMDAAESGEAAGTSYMSRRCGLCGKPLVSGSGLCLSCRNSAEHSYDRLITIFCYSGKYRKLFGAYKFSKTLSIGHFFAEIIVKACCLLSNEEKNSVIIVPVPPAPGKIKKAGWDQIEYLSRLIESGWGEPAGIRAPPITVSRCLKRLSSKVQKKLDRKNRLENLKGRIIMTQDAPDTAIIIDDVITTGATMEACAAALKASGCKKVYGVCLVYD